VNDLSVNVLCVAVPDRNIDQLTAGTIAQRPLQADDVEVCLE